MSLPCNVLYIFTQRRSPALIRLLGGMTKQRVVSVTRDTRENDVKQVSSDYFDVKTLTICRASFKQVLALFTYNHRQKSLDTYAM